MPSTSSRPQHAPRRRPASALDPAPFVATEPPRRVRKRRLRLPRRPPLLRAHRRPLNRRKPAGTRLWVPALLLLFLGTLCLGYLGADRFLATQALGVRGARPLPQIHARR